MSMFPASMPSVIDLGSLPPNISTVRRILLTTSVPVSLHCNSSLISIEPSELNVGTSWVRLQVNPNFLDDGILLFTDLQVRGGPKEEQIVIRGFIKAGSSVELPTIRVPQDVDTLHAAYALAASGDCILIDDGEWQAGLVIEKPIVLRAAVGAGVVLRSIDKPTLTVHADLVLEEISLIGENTGSAIICDGGNLRITHGQITAPHGDGLHLAGHCQAQLNTVNICDCRGTGLQLQDEAVATLSACQLHHNRQSNLKSGPKTRMEAVRSGFQRSKLGSGIWAQGHVTLKDCSAFGNAHFGLYLESNAGASVQGGTFDQNAKGSVRVTGTSSITLDKVHFPLGDPAQSVVSDPTAIVATIL